MMDRYVVGGFYRIPAERGDAESPPDAGFVPLAFEPTPPAPQSGVRPGVSGPNRFYMYGVVARLAMLAASYELEATNPDAQVYDSGDFPPPTRAPAPAQRRRATPAA